MVGSNVKQFINHVLDMNCYRFADNFMVIHVTNEYDYVYDCQRKTEFLSTLNDLYKNFTGGNLPLNFGDTIDYIIDTKQKRQIKVRAPHRTEAATITIKNYLHTYRSNSSNCLHILTTILLSILPFLHFCRCGAGSSRRAR